MRLRTGGHVKSLDGLRAFAVLSVLAYHLDFIQPARSSLLHPHGGYLGVDVFFALSGYLITTLLIAEWDRRNHIKFRGFYARRALRLYPAMLVLLLVVGLLCAHWSAFWWAPKTIGVIPWVLTYSANWGVALHGSNVWAGTLANTWSLAVEEQFYLVWPVICLVLLKVVRRRGVLAVGCLAAAGLEMWWRWHLAAHGASYTRLYNATDTHSDGLLIGCALAFFLATIPPLTDRDARWRHLARAAGLCGAAAGVWLYLYANEGPHWLWYVPATAAATALLLGSLLTYPVPIVERVLEFAPLQWVGKRSYGLYLWHLSVIVMASSLGPWSWKTPTPAYRASLVAVSLAVTAVSYTLVERPFLKLKGRLSALRDSRAAGGASLAAAA
ncbi:MAG TPA: acyltransferase [Acidimicrobiales bacterium]|nr:acyltransferase [Acidimicrobiales bacterium]